MKREKQANFFFLMRFKIFFSLLSGRSSSILVGGFFAGFFASHSPHLRRGIFSEQVVHPLVFQHCKMYCHNWHSLNKPLLVAAAYRQKAEWTAGI